MNQQFYLDLAAQGLRMPIGTDLLLHEQPDPADILLNGDRLGKTVESAARRYRTPLAFPLMDLRLEKADLLAAIGISESESDSFHFEQVPTADQMAAVREGNWPFSRRIAANQQAVSYVAEHTDLVPVGMLIGPFSLMTKLLADPISPVAMAAAGGTAAEDEDVCKVERCLQMAEAVVRRSAKAQIQAGAKALIVCEPAANIVYISPRQLRAGSDVFERFVLGPNRQLRALLREHGVDLIFHDCGELLTEMVQQFARELEPSMLSLGASRELWKDAVVVPKPVVLFGNLPTKSFYSDAVMPIDEVRRRTIELKRRMEECGHPHILGSECDVLHVSEAAETIRAKVEVMLTAV